MEHNKNRDNAAFKNDSAKSEDAIDYKKSPFDEPDEDIKKSPFEDFDEPASPAENTPVPGSSVDRNPGGTKGSVTATTTTTTTTTTASKPAEPTVGSRNDDAFDSSDDADDARSEGHFATDTFHLFMQTLASDAAASEAPGDDSDQPSGSGFEPKAMPMGPPPKPASKPSSTTTTTTTTTSTAPQNWPTPKSAQSGGQSPLIGQGRGATTTGSTSAQPTKGWTTTTPTTTSSDALRNRGSSLGTSQRAPDSVAPTHVRSSSGSEKEKADLKKLVQEQNLQEVDSSFRAIWPDYFDQSKPVISLNGFQQAIVQIQTSGSVALREHFIAVYRFHVIVCVLNQMEDVKKLACDATATKKLEKLLQIPMADCRSRIKQAQKNASSWHKEGSALVKDVRRTFERAVRDGVAEAYWECCLAQCESAVRKEFKSALRFNADILKQGIFRERNTEVSIITGWMRFYMAPLSQECLVEMRRTLPTKLNASKLIGTAKTWVKQDPDIAKAMKSAIEVLGNCVRGNGYPGKVACLIGMQIEIAESMYQDAVKQGQCSFTPPELLEHLQFVGWNLVATAFLNSNGLTTMIQASGVTQDQVNFLNLGVLGYFMKIINSATRIKISAPASDDHDEAFRLFLQDQMQITQPFLIKQASSSRKAWKAELAQRKS
ncbi:hypothetical protein VARIO8X_160004 [Burkholderiales bacterium 8X]|nr:hypothetical protein VARIO8X_160004 [Burkholderiales bacterium 8X]